jgi:hypothetical protein
MKIIQIGTNKGNDDLSQIIGNNQPEILILVEPMKLHNDDILSHYSWVNNLYLENVVVEKETGKDVEFFYHVDDGPKYEVASLIREHIYPKHPNLSDEGITSFTIKTININDLFLKYDLTDIDILFIDAEGYDDTIIFTIDFNKYNINKLYFENLHIKNEGVYEYLESFGYVIEKNVGLYGWSSLAQKQKSNFKINKIKFNSTNSITKLCELGYKYNSDKSPLLDSIHKHSYTILYDFLFSHLKYKKIKLAEIGIWENGGIKMFKDFFSDVEIHGFEKINEIMLKAKNENVPNTFYYYIDCELPETIIESFKESKGEFDIIIDDASHVYEHQINLIKNSVQFLKPGGILIIEDIFKSIDEENFIRDIEGVSKYFDSISFIETYHELQNSGYWDNDKLLIMYRNNKEI